MLKLSKRLETVASFVPRGSNVADIGTDHGYVPIYLVETGAAGHAVAMDVRKGPLDRAKEHIRAAGLEDRIEVRLSDGLMELQPKEADCVIIAGMGGELMIRILSEGRRLWDSVDYWVLSPHSEIDKVRKFLREQSFPIVRETMIKEEGKFYTVMGVEGRLDSDRPKDRCHGEETPDSETRDSESRNRESYDEDFRTEDRYGRLLIDRPDPVLKEYLEEEHRKLEGIVKELLLSEGSSAAKRRRQELILKLRQNEEAQDEMQRNH